MPSERRKYIRVCPYRGLKRKHRYSDDWIPRLPEHTFETDDPDRVYCCDLHKNNARKQRQRERQYMALGFDNLSPHLFNAKPIPVGMKQIPDRLIAGVPVKEVERSEGCPRCGTEPDLITGLCLCV